MKPIERRTFLRTTGATFATATLGGHMSAASENSSSKNPWKKAFMLGGLSKGSPLATFQLLKEAGFEGVELISPNQLDTHEVLSACEKTGLVVHGVSGSRHWRDTLSDPDPAVVARGMAAIRQEFADCKAYGGTTVLVVPAVVNRKVGYRDAYKRSQKNIRELIPDAQSHGIKVAIEEVWNKFLLSPVEFAAISTSSKAHGSVLTSTWATSSSSAFPEEWIRELGKRILKVHIKEYAKPKRFDYPLGEGKEIDWEAVRSAFEDVGYTGWITAEVGYGDVESMKDVVRRMKELLHLA